MNIINPAFEAFALFALSGQTETHAVFAIIKATEVSVEAR